MIEILDCPEIVGFSSEYAKCIKKHIELTNDTNIQKVTIKAKRELELHLVPNSPKKENVQAYYDQMSEEWFNSKDHLWNFTLNPDLRKVTVSQKKRPSDAIVKAFLYKFILKVVNNKLLRGFIKDVILFWEWGELKGKFHVNICIRADGVKCDPRTFRWIHDRFKTLEERCKFKDQRDFKLADTYNMKDAAFMSKLGHPPIHLQPEEKHSL